MTLLRFAASTTMPIERSVSGTLMLGADWMCSLTAASGSSLSHSSSRGFPLLLGCMQMMLSPARMKRETASSFVRSATTTFEVPNASSPRRWRDESTIIFRPSLSARRHPQQQGTGHAARPVPPLLWHPSRHHDRDRGQRRCHDHHPRSLDRRAAHHAEEGDEPMTRRPSYL